MRWRAESTGDLQAGEMEESIVPSVANGKTVLSKLSRVHFIDDEWRKKLAMAIGYYMRFVEGHHGSTDFIGGVPSHLPDVYPIHSATNLPMSFIAQFHVDGIRLEIPGKSFLHLYLPPVDWDPDPLIVLLPQNAQLNSTESGAKDKWAMEFDIAWDIVDDPDSEPDIAEIDRYISLARSKAKGLNLYKHCLDDGEELLLQLSEDPCNINFGGSKCLIIRNTLGEIVARYGP